MHSSESVRLLEASEELVGHLDGGETIRGHLCFETTQKQSSNNNGKNGNQKRAQNMPKSFGRKAIQTERKSENDESVTRAGM